MYSWYVFVIEIRKSSGKRNRTENFHSRELSRRIGLSCSQYEFPFRLDFTPRSFRLWKIVVTIVTECIIRGIQHDIHIYIYTHATRYTACIVKKGIPGYHLWKLRGGKTLLEGGRRRRVPIIPTAENRSSLNAERAYK